MKIVAQRSKKSNVYVNNKLISEIEKGLVLLISFTHDDTIEDIEYLVNKVINLRIFDDENGIMNKNILETNGEILSISQFTLYANTENGNRPSYKDAAKGDIAKPLYEKFNQELNKYCKTVTGIFGANMQLNIQNDGPVTIILNSKKKKR